MTDSLVTKTTQYKIKDLSIVSKIGKIDITGLFEELDIFDCIFFPSITGKIVINDTLGLTSRLALDGSEVLVIHMGKTDEDAVFRKSFRIYKQSDRQSLNNNSERYILHFISDEYLLSQQNRISQSFVGTYTQMVMNILENYLGIKSKSLSVIEDSVGVRKMVVPMKTPFDAIDLCARRAININGSPTFLFFENKVGYNFVTTSSLIKQNAIHTINFEPKNIVQNDTEMMGAMKYEVVSQFDVNKSITDGVYSGTFIGFDPTTRTIVKQYINYNELYASNGLANKVPNIGVTENRAGIKSTDMYNSKITVFPCSVFSSKSSYIKQNFPEMINYDDDTYNYVFQREASLRSLLTQRLKLAMPGNFDLTSGTTANIIIPNRSEQSPTEDAIDYSLSGKYLIIASRQIISYNKHITVVEVATDSTNRDNYYYSTNMQDGAIADYA